MAKSSFKEFLKDIAALLLLPAIIIGALVVAIYLMFK